jgi:hypothetical protein
MIVVHPDRTGRVDSIDAVVSIHPGIRMDLDVKRELF